MCISAVYCVGMLYLHNDIFLTDIIRYSIQNEILATPLLVVVDIRS